MDTLDILSVMSGSKVVADSGVFRGVFPLDEFMNEMTLRQDGMYIFNTDPSGSPGRHWLAVNSYSSICEFFDSYGLPTSFFSLDNFFKELGLTVVNYQKRFQGEMTSTCGDYAVMFCLLRSKGWSYKTIISKFLRVKNPHQRDHLVRHLITHVVSKSEDIELENVHLQSSTPFCKYI